MTNERGETGIQAEQWLKNLGISEPCGLDRLRDVELRDLARQIQWAIDQAGNKAFMAANGR
jgi:hypothetical protein